MSSAAFFEPLVRTRHFIDRDGVVSYVKAYNDEIAITFNLTDHPDVVAGGTVDSAAYEDSGVTTSAKSVTSPSIFFTVTGLGHTKVTATLSTGRTYEREFRFYDKGGSSPEDYGG